MNPLGRIRRWLYRLNLQIDYGPRLVRFGERVYLRVEELLGDHAAYLDRRKRREEKQAMFLALVQADYKTWKRAMGYTPLNWHVDSFRQKIWKVENWGKTPSERRRGCQTG